LAIGDLLETEQHDIGAILRESLQHESRAVEAYRKLLKLVENNSIQLEEYARAMIMQEEAHIGEVDKMLRAPGSIDSVIAD